MSRNPYAPPIAPVEDVTTAPAGDNSLDVGRACRLLWASFGAQWIEPIVDLIRNPDAAVGLAVLGAISLGIGFLITRWFVRRLTARSNGMRMFLTTSVVVGILVIAIFWEETIAFSAVNPPKVVMLCIQGVLQTIAVGYLWTARSRAYF